MKLDSTYFGMKDVDGRLIGKLFYDTKDAADLDLDRLRRVAEMKWKSAEASGNRDAVDSAHAEHLRLHYVKVVQFKATEI